MIEKLLSGIAIKETERDSLVLYVATMLMRVPTRRKRALSMAPQIAESTKAKFSAQIRDARRSGKISAERHDQLVAAIDEVTEKALAEPSAAFVAHIRTPWPSEGILKAIARMTFRVVRTEGPTFFTTSDNPVFFFPSLGVGTDQSEISVPLSTSHALHGSHRGPSSADLMAFSVHQQHVREFNRRTVSSAERFVFCHEDSQGISRLVRKENLRLQRMVW